jgi:hypothetical protein
MNVFDKRYWISLSLFFLWSCQTEREEPMAVDMDYYPLETGKFWVYEVNETIYFGEGDYEEIHYFYRDEIAELYINEAGESVYIMNRQRSEDRTEWTNEQVYALRVSDNRLIRLSDNLQEIILVFPLRMNLEWDANGANSQAPHIYTLDAEGPYVVKNRYFPSTVRVLQNDEDDMITIRDIRYNIYAEGVGLVESYYEVFNYCTRNDCLGEQIIQNGRLTHLKLVSDGST